MTTNASKMREDPKIQASLLIAGFFLFLWCISPVAGENPSGTGYYEVRSNIENASVYFDGTLAGTIQKGILLVPAETSNKPVHHILMITADGYSTYNETVLQAPKPGKNTILRGILTKLPPANTGTLSLAVTPPGAAISLDGTPLGTVDSSGIRVLRDIKAGFRVIVVTLPGYQDWKDRVNVEANMDTKVRVILSPATSGTLQVTSAPSGANVFVNGSIAGITPVTLTDIPVGETKIRLTLPGYQEWTGTTSVAPGQVTPVSGTLIQIAVNTSVPAPIETTPEMTPVPEPTQAALFPLIAGGALAIVSLFPGKKE
ncbi:MAG: PEGA domain-containing protein [Methanospirillum sp.]|nr:PEGA domain-containing protein [Methanospirillum sp.]